MKIELDLTKEEVQHLVSLANLIDKEDLKEMLDDSIYQLDYVDGGIVEDYSLDVLDTIFWKVFDQLRPMEMFDKYNDTKPILHDDVTKRVNSNYREGR